MTYNLLIEGKVQGVFYRASAKEMADELGIVGWVKNTKDGAVELVCQGEETALQRFIDWCRNGPSQAKVESVHIQEVPAENFDGFRVIRGK